MLRIACCAVLVGVALGEFGPKEPENDVCKLPKDYCEKAVEAGEDCITPLFYGLVRNFFFCNFSYFFFLSVPFVGCTSCEPFGGAAHGIEGGAPPRYQRKAPCAALR